MGLIQQKRKSPEPFRLLPKLIFVGGFFIVGFIERLTRHLWGLFYVLNPRCHRGVYPLEPS